MSIDSDFSDIIFTSDEDSDSSIESEQPIEEQIKRILDIKLKNNDIHIIKKITDFLEIGNCEMCDEPVYDYNDDAGYVCKKCIKEYTCICCEEYAGECSYKCEFCPRLVCQDTRCTDGYMNVYVNGTMEICYECMEEKMNW